MSIQVSELFVKIVAKTQEWDAALKKVDQQVTDASRKLVFNPKVDPKSVLSLNQEMKRLKERATELRGNLLTLKPTVENPNVIKDLEHELGKVEDRLRLVTDAAKDASEGIEQMGETSETLTSIGKKLSVGVTAPLVAAGTALLAIAMRAGGYAEEMNNMSQATGLSAQTLQELKFVADNAGLSFDAVTTAVIQVQRKLMGVEQDSGMAADAFKMLGINIRDAGGNLLGMDVLFPLLITRLQSMENQTERNMIAAQIFGRGFGELAPILGMTADEMKKAVGRAHELGVVMSDDALDAAMDFDDAVDDLKQQFVGLERQLATELLPVIQNDLIPIVEDNAIPAIKSLTERVINLVRWFGNLSDAGKTLVGFLVSLIAISGPAIMAIGSLGSALTYLQLKALAANVTVGALVGTIAAWAGVITLAVAALGALGIALYEGKKAWDDWRESKERAQQSEETYQAAKSTGKPTYRQVAEELGFGDRWAKGDLTDKEKQLMKAEMDRRTAVYTQAHPSKAVPYTPPPAEDIELATAAEEDIKAAQNVSYEMRKRNADELGKLGIEREQALSEAAGPTHRQAIIEDFADRERALKEKLAEEERERQEKIAKRVEDLLQQGIANSIRAHKQRLALIETETQAYEKAKASQLRIAGQTQEAELQEAMNTYNRGYRDLQRRAGEGEPVYNRWLALVSEFEERRLDIIAKYQEKEDQVRRESELATLESEREKANASMSMWERVTATLNSYADRLVSFVYGEGAMRLQQLERQREAERKAIMESIADEELRAQVIEMLDKDYELRRAEIGLQEEQRYVKQMRWIDRINQAVHFTDAEGMWKNLVTQSAGLSFSAPNLTQQLSMPAINVDPGAELSRISDLLAQANQMHDESARRLRDIDSRLGGIE